MIVVPMKINTPITTSTPSALNSMLRTWADRSSSVRSSFMAVVPVVVGVAPCSGTSVPTRRRSTFAESAPCAGRPQPFAANSPGSTGKWQATVWPGLVAAGPEVIWSSGGSSVRQISWAFQQRVWKRHAGRRVDRAGHVAGEADPLAGLAAPGVGHRDGREHRHGVGVARAVVEVVAVADLDDLAEVHHGDPVRDVAYDGQVVRDHHVGQVELLLEVLEQVDHLGLDGDVERGDRLVGHDQLRLERERAGDADALALAAGELVRVAVVVLRVQPDGLQQVLHRLLPATLGLDVLQPERRTDDLADGVPRVQRGVRVLEDHLDVATQRAHLPVGEVRDVVALEGDLAAGRLEQPGHQPRGGALAAAGLADDRERLAAAYVEVHAVDGLDGARRLAAGSPPPIGKCLTSPSTFRSSLARRWRGGVVLSVRGCRHCSLGVISCAQMFRRSADGMWQATKCSAAVVDQVGAVVQAGRADPLLVVAARVERRSPSGTLIRLGGVPLIGSSRSVGGLSKRGIEPSSPQV